MIEKINSKEIDKIYNLIYKKKIEPLWIKKALKIDNIGDMDKLQYNFLLLILNQLNDF